MNERVWVEMLTFNTRISCSAWTSVAIKAAMVVGSSELVGGSPGEPSGDGLVADGKEVFMTRDRLLWHDGVLYRAHASWLLALSLP